jgi:hypothetical protein
LDSDSISLQGEIHDTVQYPGFSSPEKLQNAADQFRKITEVANEATLIARLMPSLFIFSEVPD